MADISAHGQEVAATLAHIDAALDRTRPDRGVWSLTTRPNTWPSGSGRRRTPAGKAVWCHDAVGFEVAVDRNDGRITHWRGRSQRTDRARHRFHVTALCSPTRAALLTGRNHHAVGFGQIGEFSSGFPRDNLCLTATTP